jgi:DNA-binding CsgD family transcriptional regulator
MTAAPTVHSPDRTPRPPADAVLTLGAGALRAVARLGELAGELGDPDLHADEAIGAMAEVVRCDALSLSSWDPVLGAHRHVAALGYPEHLLEFTNGPGMLADPGYQHCRAVGGAPRQCDVPGSQRHHLVTEVLTPAGYGEGMTACLWTRDGRYTGMINVSVQDDRPQSETDQVLLTVLAAAAARLVDPTRSLRTVAAVLEPGTAAVVLADDGAPSTLPGYPDRALLALGPGVLAEARRRAPLRPGVATFLWRADAGLHRITAVRVSGTGEHAPSLVVGAAPADVPLTTRELEVLTQLATGATNPQIAERLVVTRHTVARHIEHILDKLGVATRSAAAATAIGDGLLLADTPPPRLVT